MRRVVMVMLAAMVAGACSSGVGEPAAPTTAPGSSTTPEATVPEEPGSTGTTTSVAGGPTTLAPPATTAPPAFAGLALRSDAGMWFSASGACASCHQQMTDATGADVSIDAAWRSTMMANAARDPYWLATVRSEIQRFPALAGVIEDKCTTCHMPMGRTTAAFEGGAGVVLDAGFGDPEHPLHGLGVDGVSCSVCHQIEPDGFGAIESFSGGFSIDADAPRGERLAFGPYVSPPGPAQIMQSVSGFLPVQGTHIQESEMCATCHTLSTPTVDAGGNIVGEFPEQTPYLEWLASTFAGTTSCQDCHLPEAEGTVQLSVTGGPPRAPFSQHHFVGGNTFMISVFRALGEDLGVTASSEHFDATLARIEAQLAERTAVVTITGAQSAGGVLSAAVTVENLTGHKFPTGFPSRRAWLHVTVLDGSGRVVFESGAWQPDGSIAGNDNDADPALFEPHYGRITDPGEVQIYEPIVGDTEGRVTTTLLSGAGYLKDNRLLPTGFDAAIASPDVLPAGAATADADFAGGGDTILYRIDLADATGPFTIEAELLFQSIGYRWAENLLDHDGAEIDAFAAALETVPIRPARIAFDTASVGG